MTAPIRLLLADDHELVRSGLRMVLNFEPDLDVVAEAGDGPDAVRAAQETPVDVAVLDVTMPRLNGLQAARQIRSYRPAVRIVLLSMHDNEQYLLDAQAAGANAYVLKASADEELVDAIRRVHRGEPFVYPSVLDDETVRRLADPGDEAGGPLTARETEVVKLVAEGHSTREIAAILTISERTVDRHRANAMEKLDVRDRVGLTRYAIRIGLVEP